MPPTLVLASQSPRRRDLLETLGLEFTSRPVDLDETPLPNESPEAYVRRLALDKARARAEDGEIVLAADTIVVLGNRLLGKPADEDEARTMLRALSGRLHLVLTGVAVHAAPSRTQVATCTSSVRIASLTEQEIDWYVGTGEPLDKAGAYAIQGLGSLLVEEIEGNYSNVVGLPLPTVYRLFRSAGLDLRDFRRAEPAPPGINFRT